MTYYTSRLLKQSNINEHNRPHILAYWIIIRIIIYEYRKVEVFTHIYHKYQHTSGFPFEMLLK